MNGHSPEWFETPDDGRNPHYLYADDEGEQPHDDEEEHQAYIEEKKKRDAQGVAYDIMTTGDRQ